MIGTLTLTVLLATAQPASPGEESDRIREEIKAKWGVLVKDGVRKELKITQNVLYTGFIDTRTRNLIKLKNEMDKKMNVQPSTGDVFENRKPIQLTNSIILRSEGRNSEIEFQGDIYDIVTGKTVQHHEHGFYSGTILHKYSKLKDQKGVAQIEDKKASPAYQKYLESSVCSFLFGYEHQSSDFRWLQHLEFARTNRQIIGLITKSNGEATKYIFAPEYDCAVTHFETTQSNRTTKFEARYDRRLGTVIPVEWTIKFFENGNMSLQRSCSLLSYRAGDNVDNSPGPLKYPVDTVVIERDGDKEKYGRVTNDGSIIPMNRKDYHVPLDQLIAKDKNASRMRAFAILLAMVGVAGLVGFLWRSRKKTTQPTFPPGKGGSE
jgi:hypothetical protein